MVGSEKLLITQEGYLVTFHRMNNKTISIYIFCTIKVTSGEIQTYGFTVNCYLVFSHIISVPFFQFLFSQSMLLCDDMFLAPYELLFFSLCVLNWIYEPCLRIFTYFSSIPFRFLPDRTSFSKLEINNLMNLTDVNDGGR